MTELDAIKESLQVENPNYKNVCILILESLAAMSNRVNDLESKVHSFDVVVDKLSARSTGGPSIG